MQFELNVFQFLLRAGTRIQMCSAIFALKYALFSLFDCWETHSYTHFEGDELSAEREHTS